MNYYALEQREDRGCPLGMLQGELHPRFFLDAKKFSYGTYPWYANPYGRFGEVEKFPEGLCFITSDKLYNFAVRSDSFAYHLISEDFLACIQRAGGSLLDFQRVDVKSRVGKDIAERQYFAAKFPRHDVSIAEDSDLSQFLVKAGSSTKRIKKLAISPKFSDTIFCIKGIDPANDTIFCSEDFYLLAKDMDFKGVEFIRLEDVVWPTLRRI
ncbi:hypothetical protein SAMN02745857_03573 [Andreprevotia lacus DSM 23236]|jgi:hypothetical protein|uniref:Immunity protein 43 domain-containing protein n=1 Tax=Andreprevotia lacus DSM 23236 TaxID=1121001 RepID=A0A1W1XYS9_9NEIS|nr:hypothetical protein [Andreprevotia lacus]SMC29052.1 hypothetical protein SAMN02745857_03573 [Andreprevotia lacus DSM 23236]